MWWPDIARPARLAAVLALAGLTGGCFQPIYGERTVYGSAGPGVGYKMAGVDVAPIDAPNGDRIARIGVNVRNELIFDLTGGGSPASATHQLKIKLTATTQQVIVDINTARPDIQNYALNATYTLTDLATGKPVVNGTTFARVSYDIPGQEQRFAGARGLRDAENRAAKDIAENIRTRLASYFVAGT
jgi:LPS-assembly lipoprotein